MKKWIETDPDTGVDIYQLTSSAAGSRTVYGEQPLTDPAGNRTAVLRLGEQGTRLVLLDVDTGEEQEVATNVATAWHAWGPRVYYRESDADGGCRLVALDYQSLERQVYDLAIKADPSFSHGTVSCDGRYYAVVSGSLEDGGQVHLFDLASGGHEVIWEGDNCTVTHAQFSMGAAAADRHELLLQINEHRNGVKEDIHLILVPVPGYTPVRQLGGGTPQTLMCSGHQCWCGDAERVVFSTMYDEQAWGNLWLASVTDESARLVCRNHTYFGHVAATRCGRFWIADGHHEPETPVYAGRLDQAKYRRLFNARTRMKPKSQYGHTHLYATPDNRHIIFTSSRTGHEEVYVAVIPDYLWECLSTETLQRERRSPVWSGNSAAFKRTAAVG